MYINTHTSVCMHVCICVNCIFASRPMKATFLEWGQTLRFLSYAQTPSETISRVNFIIKLILCWAGAPCNQVQWLFQVCKEVCVTEYTDCLLKPTRNLISWCKSICSINNNLLKLITIIYTVSESCRKLQHSGRSSKAPVLIKEEQELDYKVRLIVPPTSQLSYLNQTL